MFDAVKEYVTRKDPSKSTLIDIRFVNIDDLTVEVFKKEFIEFFQIQKDNLLASGPKTPNPSRPKRGKNKGTSGPSDVNHPLTPDINSSPKSFSDALKGKSGEEGGGEKKPSASLEGSFIFHRGENNLEIYRNSTECLSCFFTPCSEESVSVTETLHFRDVAFIVIISQKEL